MPIVVGVVERCNWRRLSCDLNDGIHWLKCRTTWSRTFEFFNDELTELQEELDCPDEFICDFLEVIKNRWSPDSCHAKARQHKRDNPSFY